MIRSRRSGRRLLTLAARLALAGAAATVPAGAAAAPLAIQILTPREEAVFGEVEMLIAFSGERGTKVEFKVDGRLAATLTQPPFRIKVDVGDKNIEHVFEAKVYGVSGATATARRVTPRLQVDEEVEIALQPLFVTVTDGERRVSGLTRDQFRVEEDGRRQEIVTFETGDVPLTAVLLVDSSESMRGGRLEAAVRGASLFVKGMKKLDEAMLLLFSDRLLRSTPFTESPEEIAGALEGIEAGGGTAVNDHLYLAFNRLDERLGRRVVILFSDGADVLSALRMEEVLWKARRSAAIIYWLRLEEAGRNPRTSFSSTWRSAPENMREFDQLEEAVQQSGGRVEVLTSVDQIESAFGGVLRELRDQYVLGYYSNQRRGAGTLHRIDVGVRGESYRVRTRESYVE